MGAENFTVWADGKTAKDAFDKAVAQAQYDYGHSGYTGSIAEKNEFVMIEVPKGEDPREYADELINDSDDRIDDKWGPAGCIDAGDGRYLFFGWAPS